MSKRLNPETESSVTCGFYNGADCAYEAAQMSTIFDGIIRDGIFSTIGECFVVTADAGNSVIIETGKAWFNHTWTLNDAPLPITCPDSNDLLDRIDAVVLEVNSDISVRDNSFKVITGEPSDSPSRPALTKANGVYQYALCYIYRKAESTEIVQADITNAIGTTETPFITGILEVVSLDTLLGQWQDDLDRFVVNEKVETEADLAAFKSTTQQDFDEWYAGMKQLMMDVTEELDTWTENEKATILDWFENMKDQLSEDSAINLQMQINRDYILSTLQNGFTDGSKTFSEDGTTITSINSDGYKLVKTFTDNFSTSVIVFTNPHDVELGRMVKTFSEDGTVTNIVTTVSENVDPLHIALTPAEEASF